MACLPDKAVVMLRLSRLLLFALSWVHAVAVYDPDLKLETARLYGNIVGYAYWYVDVSVGTPAQRVSVILDTGSGLLAFPCRGCEHCGDEHHIDPLFNVQNSSTATWLTCHTSECDNRGCGPGDKCLYSQGYLEGSSIRGYYFQDYISLGDSFQQNPAVKARLGCHIKETKLFYTQKANGIFGIQGHTSVLQDYFRDKSHVNSKIFSVCLASYGGRLTVGGVTNVAAAKKIQWMSLSTSMYTVPLTKIETDGSHIGPFGQTLVDSGTTFTYFASAHYKWLTKVVEDHCHTSGTCGKLDKGCWSDADLKGFPVFQFHFNPDVVVDWNPREYMYALGRSNRYCYGFKNDGNTRTTTLGATFMLYKEVIFDLDAKKIGFLPEECPEHKARPKVSSLEPIDTVVPTSTPASVSPTTSATPGTSPASGSPTTSATAGAATAATDAAATQTTPANTTHTKPANTTQTTTTLGATSSSSTSADQANVSIPLIQRSDDEEELPADSTHWWRQGSLSPAQIIIPALVLLFIIAVAATTFVVKPKPVTLSTVEDDSSDGELVSFKSKQTDSV